MSDAIVTRLDVRHLLEAVAADTPNIHHHRNALARVCQQMGFILEVTTLDKGKPEFAVKDQP